MNLPRSILQEKWYPRDRPFSEFEARLDFLLFVEGSETNLEQLYLRWNWSKEDANALIEVMIEEQFVSRFDEDSLSRRKMTAIQIIDLYNDIFERTVHFTEHRCSLISARIKEGRKQVPPIALPQFKAVFEFKKKEWTGTEQEKYLTIETLCAAKHFQNYLEAARLAYTKKKKQKMTATEPGFMPTPLFKK